MVQTRINPAAANWFLTIMALVFAVFMAWQGDKLTSKQWEYLMTVPGGKWSWAVVYGTLGAFCMWGLIRRNAGHVASGLFGIGLFCGFVAVCYILAPLQDSSLRTGGWWPWIVSAAAYFGVGSVNAGDRT